MKTLFYIMLVLIIATSCSKNKAEIVEKTPTLTTSISFNKYTIRKGQHFSDQTLFKAVSIDEMKFMVWFDSTAIYQSVKAENQLDINKLYGFSDNEKDHHQYSARMGWRWSDRALRLFAYVYNAGSLESKEISTIPIGEPILCSIKVLGNQYIFNVNGITESMPRQSTTATGKGYQLFPYFGGDEVAPENINIYISDN